MSKTKEYLRPEFVTAVSNEVTQWDNIRASLNDPWNRNENYKFISAIEETKANGIYIFKAKKISFPFPLGNTSIYYIGSGATLARRIREKLQKDFNDTRIGKNERISTPAQTIYHYPTSTYYYRWSTQIFYSRVNGKLGNSIKDVEEVIIAAFHLKFGFRPTCNRTSAKAVIWTKEQNRHALTKIGNNLLTFKKSAPNQPAKPLIEQ